MRPRVLLFEPIHTDALAWLRKRAEVTMAADLSKETVFSLVAGADGLVIRAHGRVDDRLLGAAPRLRVVGRHGVGLDNIDVAACTRRGVWVVHTPLAGVEAVAEHAVALMLAVARGIVRSDRAVRAGEFDTARMALAGRELAGRTLGVIGFGRIGRRTAEICRAAFGMTVLFADALPRAEEAARLPARRVELADLLGQSEIVTVHLPLTAETRHLLDRQALAAMKRGAILINTSRGAVIDEAALVEILRAGHLSAGLDVFEEEPLPPEHPLTGLPNVVLTPHAASHSEEGLRAMAAVVEDVMRVLSGEAPRYPANMPQAPLDAVRGESPPR
ncbi:MAG TPA: hydroxyacid dehydrogenase [bacterium]|jgi:D-3-phosphoglycerate dehydrogenase|nr:hydroxyacid dehydrogenase [bacterium]